MCHPNTLLIENIEELRNFYPPEGISEWIIRAAYSTAGNGILRLNREDFFKDKKINSLEKIVLDSPIVLEPYLKRLMDIGIVINLNSPFELFNYKKLCE